MGADWNDYIESFHRERAGVTEEVLRGTRLGTLDPYSWLSAVVTPTRGPVLDIGSGSGPVAGTFTRWIGIDRSADELRIARDRDRAPLVRATAAALPIRTGGSDTALCVMSLQVLRPLEAVFAELARVLRPRGQMVVLLPARRPLPVRDLIFYGRLQRRLGQAIGYPNDDRLGGKALAALAASHGFVVEDDVRDGFMLRLQSRGDAERLVHSLYMPGIEGGRVDRAVALVERRVGRSVTIPLRRVVLRRQASTAARTRSVSG